MNNEQEQGFFNQIEEVLQTHEETYELGAWEEFDANREKKKRKWPIYIWTAAAVVLLCFGFGLFEIVTKNEPQQDGTFVKNSKKQEVDTAIPLRKDSIKILHQPLQNNRVATTSSSRSLKVIRNNLAVAIQNPIHATITQTDRVIASVQQNQILENAASSSLVVGSDKPVVRKQDKYTAGAYDSLANRNRVDAITEKSKNKLTYSLVVSPSLSNQKVNFGAGMELSYAVGNHLSINSGLMYTALNAKSDGKSLAMANSSPQSAHLAVSGVELPLGIQYQTNSGFYASAGVSALGLITDKLEYSFFQEKTVTFSNGNAGFMNEVLKVVSERKTEKSIEPLTNYMGFFNFSVGKKQALGNLKFNVGPFVKVPFSSVSSEKIKLLQGGIKISVDF